MFYVPQTISHRWLVLAKVPLLVTGLLKGEHGEVHQCWAQKREQGDPRLALARDLCPFSSCNTLLCTGVTTMVGLGVSRRLVEERPGTDVVERAGRREKEFDSKDMFLEGDKAPPASSGNCFV